MKTIALLIFVAVLAGCVSTPNQAAVVNYICETQEEVENNTLDNCVFFQHSLGVYLIQKVGETEKSEIWQVKRGPLSGYTTIGKTNVQPPRISSLLLSRSLSRRIFIRSMFILPYLSDFVCSTTVPELPAPANHDHEYNPPNHLRLADRGR